MTQSGEGMDSYVTLKITSGNCVGSGTLCLALFECQYFLYCCIYQYEILYAILLKCVLKKFCICMCIIYPVNHRGLQTFGSPLIYKTYWSSGSNVKGQTNGM